MRRHLVLLPALAALAIAPEAGAYSPVLHERIAPDPQDDLTLNVAVEGDLPAAMKTPSGVVRAPDPRSPVDPREPTASRDTPASTFRPDRDTRRPDVLPYDDPFVPSTAPFKRLFAYDSVAGDFSLTVRDPRMMPASTGGAPAGDGTEEQFYANMVVDLVPGRPVRVPNVGPGARVLRARAGVGTREIPVRFARDGADNSFVEGDFAGRARLVIELTIPRAAFGGDFGDPSWSALPPQAPLPATVTPSAAEVSKKIGVSRSMRPREVVARLVAYFRSFVDSEDPPRGGRDVYSDLALSKKGVCRHRAFAFLITAQHLGIPTRMIVNEAHAWVEVFDGALWRRIDLGGAGRALGGEVQDTVPHEPPPDPFAWPPGATRGEELADRARSAHGGDANHDAASKQDAGSGAGGGGGSSGNSGGSGAGGSAGRKNGGGSGSENRGGQSGGANGGGADGNDRSGGAANGGPESAGGASDDRPDDRPPSRVTLTAVDGDARRGAPLHVAGDVSSDGDPCEHVTVEILLRDAKKRNIVPLGALATDEHGAYAGALVVPAAVPLGDYDVVAQTPGDTRCGRGGGF
jgi:transglutaminase-like putative cysteine protease